MRETEKEMETEMKQSAGSRPMVLRAPVIVTQGLMSESPCHREWRLTQLATSPSWTGSCRLTVFRSGSL